MNGCEDLTIKKAEHRRIDVFILWCWRRLLRILWTARRSNQSILKEINPENSLEGLMLKLKLQYFGHVMWTANSLEKTLMLGKREGKRRGLQKLRWLDDITKAMDMNLGKLQEMVRDRESWCATVHGDGKSWTLVSPHVLPCVSFPAGAFSIFLLPRVLQSTAPWIVSPLSSQEHVKKFSYFIMQKRNVTFLSNISGGLHSQLKFVPKQKSPLFSFTLQNAKTFGV